MKDVCLIYTNSFTQGRIGTHTFDLVFPPLGISYLAAVLEGVHFSVDIIDANAELLTDQELLARIENQYAIIGFYCHTQNYGQILALSQYLKKSASAPFIVIGGPHATAMPEESLLGHPELDAAVFGEAEGTIVEMVQRILSGEELLGVKGVACRIENGAVFKNPPREQIVDLDSLPMPAWHLLPMHRYRNIIESGGRSAVHVMGSRGCPIDCNYCFSTKMWTASVSWHSPDRVLAEVDHLREYYKIQFIQFMDDNFTLLKERVAFLTGEFRKRKLRWCCSTRIDLIDEEILGYLKKGRIDHLSMGIETVNDRLLAVIGKKITKEQIKRSIVLCAKFKVRVLGMFIFGIPTETDEEAEENITFIKKYRFYLTVFSYMTMYPGTNFWHRYRNAIGLSKDFSKYCLSKHISYIEPGRNQTNLEKLMKRAYLSFYTKPRVLWSLMILMLKNPRHWFKAMRAFLGIFIRLLFRR